MTYFRLLGIRKRFKRINANGMSENETYAIMVVLISSEKAFKSRRQFMRER